LPPETLSRGVDVGVAVLLQSADQKLLLTRRASSLRIFPNVWVPPGECHLLTQMIHSNDHLLK